MSKRVGGHNFHPSRTSGMQKQMRAREMNNLNQHLTKPKLQPLDLTKGDWSTRNANTKTRKTS